MDNSKVYMYEHYTWPELNEKKVKVVEQPVVILPVGSVEQHGFHLPIDTDNYIIWRACQDLGERIPEEVLILPLIPYGYEAHHADFPATIMIRQEVMRDFVCDVTKSVAYHGFKRILIIDGHGSNMPILDLAARKTVLETEALCAVFMWTNLVADVAKEVRESDFPGGMCHAGELETSVYLHLAPERVSMEKARKDIREPKSKYIWRDLVQSSPVQMMNWFSQMSESGAIGDATVASAEKGRIVYEKLVERFIDLVREFKRLRVPPRQEHH